MAYSLSPVRNSVRRTVTSLKSMGRMPAELSMVRLTSARPSAGRVAVPAKMTSSIFWLRTALGAWAPSTQAMASTTFDLPRPVGPDDDGDAGLELQRRGLGERLEALEGQLFRNTAPAKLQAPERHFQGSSLRGFHVTGGFPAPLPER